MSISLPEGTIRLSQRQWEILEHLKAGRANKAIAYELGISTGTVKQHLVVLFKKLGVTNRAMAVAKGMSAKNSLSVIARHFSEHPDKIIERRPAVVLSLQLAPPKGDGDGKLKKDYYKIFTCVAFDFDTVFLRQSDFRCEMIFGIRSIRSHDILRAIRAAIAVSEGIRVKLRLGKNVLKGGVSFGTLIASMDSRGCWTGETIYGDVVASSRKLCSMSLDGTLLLDRASRNMISFLGAEVSGAVPESIPLRSTFSWTRCPLPAPASLVGRNNEIKIFKSCIEKLTEGTGGILLVEGETGMGKSSLIQYFAGICRENNVDCHTWVSLNADSQPAAPSLGHLIRPHASKMASMDDICDELMGQHFSRPTAVMIDDCHLQPASCLKRLRQTIKKLAATVLFVVTGRRQSLQFDSADNDATVINLHRLSDMETKKIIVNILGKDNQEITRMARLAMGVPVFATEMANETSCQLASPLDRDASMPILALFSLVMERICKTGIDRHLLYFVATMPEPVNSCRLQQLYITAGEGFEKELDKAVDTGLLCKYPGNAGKEGEIIRFTHPFLRLVASYMLEKNGTLSMPMKPSSEG